MRVSEIINEDYRSEEAAMNSLQLQQALEQAGYLDGEVLFSSFKGLDDGIAMYYIVTYDTDSDEFVVSQCEVSSAGADEPMPISMWSNIRQAERVAQQD